jgi:hypothetical protein
MCPTPKEMQGIDPRTSGDKQELYHVLHIPSLEISHTRCDIVHKAREISMSSDHQLVTWSSPDTQSRAVCACCALQMIVKHLECSCSCLLSLSLTPSLGLDVLVENLSKTLADYGRLHLQAMSKGANVE